MILTGNHIVSSVENGDIVIEPFNLSQVNPNSYNYRLGKTLKKCSISKSVRHTFNSIVIPEDGFVLQPGTMYLGHTHETIGSKRYAMSLIGRSSIGRLGLFVQISANLGHTQSCHRWTLEIVATHRVRVYPHMIFGQVSFWQNKGKASEYAGTYGFINQPQESLVHF